MFAISLTDTKFAVFLKCNVCVHNTLWPVRRCPVEKLGRVGYDVEELRKTVCPYTHRTYTHIYIYIKAVKVEFCYRPLLCATATCDSLYK